jgi:glutamate-1-semialdehyde aminotransferase
MNIAKGSQLWDRAKQIIPGGNQLLSKRSEMFLPNQWPSYYKKAKGVEIWDLDDNHFFDMSIMGVGTCILGYADDEVDQQVKKAIDGGSITTLNCFEEVELAELLLELHGWAGMVKFARTGGEAMALAIRIARAHTSKDQVAFCGYHGWHDWYLAANLADKTNLDGQLLPGLAPSGVPRGLLGSAIPFEYNNISQLKAIVERNNIGTIVMEPVRHQKPTLDFLEHVKTVADEIGAVLIFDEITTGWRMTVGGVHKLYGVDPDIVVYAKAMSNGYPMAAIVGKNEVLDSAKNSFISSTYWTERIGPVASIATINKIRDRDVPTHLCKIGNLISDGWQTLAKEHSLEIAVVGIPPLTTFTFNHGVQDRALHTLFTQLMLDGGFLASKSVYVSLSHTEPLVNDYLENVDEAFGTIEKSLSKNNISELLRGPVAGAEFKRLT